MGGEIPVLSPHLLHKLKPLISLVLRGSVFMAKGMTRALTPETYPKIFFDLHELDIQSEDFVSSIEKIIYHLDEPVAGPGSFPQYEISRLASKHRKVVLGGQGGDEIFGGYARYLIAYFEQCIKGAIDGTLNNGNFVVTYASIIPNLRTLEQYKPMLKQFWSNGLFDSINKRYFDLVNRAPTLQREIRWENLKQSSTYDEFLKIFLGKNVGHESYFDLMTHLILKLYYLHYSKWRTE